MKIAVISPTFPPYAGGIGKVAAYNAVELSKLGYQIKVFTPLYQAVKEELTDLEIKRIKPLFKYGNAACLPTLAKKLKGFDVIHLHYPFFGAAEIILLQNLKSAYWTCLPDRQAGRFKIQNSKLVLHYHMDVIGQGFLKTIFKFHNQFILPQIVKKADKIILTSLDYGKNSNLARWLGNYPAKFLEVPNGVDSQKFQPQPKNLALLGQYGIDPKDKIVLFVGGLDQAHYFKGVPYLIEAMDRLQQANYQWQLMIVGEGELKKDYFDFANQLGVGHKTIFAGYVADNDLPSYYNLADVCVLPSIDQSEAFGLTLLEAMACAKPVVATNLAGVRTVVDDGLDGLLVQPKNANDLAAKINYLLTNFNIAQQFGKNGRRKIEQNYEWGMIGKKLDAVYLSLY